MSTSLDRAWTIMSAVRACMFVTHDGDAMRARPMAAQPDPASTAIWFFTSLSSAKSDELHDDQRTCLIFHQTEGGVFLSVSGRTRLLHDRDLMRRKWDREAGLWFDSPDNPDVVLLRVQPESAEFWTRPGDFDRVALAVRQARAEGREPDIGVNEKVSF